MLTGGVSCELYGSLEIRDYCRTHTFSVEEKADGEIVDHVHEVNRKC